jgi:magnesium chelatase subunit H
MARTSTSWSTAAAFGDEDELADAYEARKSFAYGATASRAKTPRC